jgi:glyoxylase-like metal-dependent hydrolase (beta-lactamase superfamily II)
MIRREAATPQNCPETTMIGNKLTNAAAVAALVALTSSAQPAGGLNPMIRQDAAVQVSAHVYVIPDGNVALVPNVGIVIGDRATLIVDTGLGDRNGEIVLAEARKLSGNEAFYLTATHYHPEHDLGANAFPASSKMIRWSAQQAEADEIGAETIQRFSSFAPVVARLLDGAGHRAPDILFDDEVTIDLGGVRVRAIGVGPNHTLGDTVFWVEGDRVLFTGDVVMPAFPAVSGQSGSLALWQRNLDLFESLDPETIVPSHGRLGGIELVHRYRDYLGAVQQRVAAAKAGSASLDEVTAALGETLAADFSVLAPPSGNAGGRINAAIQAAYREAR